MERVCEQCGANFTPKAGNAGRFCSRDCYKNAKRIVVDRICAYCGTAFTVAPWRIANGSELFCSANCRYQSARTSVSLQCEQCGVTFTVRLSKARNGRRFCSRKCKGLAYQRRTSRICEICGQSFITPIYEVNMGRGGRFCSRECRVIWHGETFTGEKASAWRGGISFEPYPPTFNKQFKRMIRERDSYTCALCNKPNSIQVHHINYVKMDTHPENCVTLCRRCHGKTNSNRAHWQAYFEAYMQARAA